MLGARRGEPAAAVAVTKGGARIDPVRKRPCRRKRETTPPRTRGQGERDVYLEVLRAPRLLFCLLFRSMETAACEEELVCSVCTIRPNR